MSRIRFFQGEERRGGPATLRGGIATFRICQQRQFCGAYIWGCHFRNFTVQVVFHSYPLVVVFFSQKW